MNLHPEYSNVQKMKFLNKRSVNVCVHKENCDPQEVGLDQVCPTRPPRSCHLGLGDRLTEVPSQLVHRKT